MSALAQRLRALRETSERTLAPDVREKLQRHIDHIRAAGALLRALRPGVAVQEFSLRDQSGRHVSLETLLAEGPLVIAFERGLWCQYSRAHITALGEMYARIRETGAHCVVITPQSAASAAPYLRELRLPLRVLVDPDAKVAESFGLDYDLPPYMISLSRSAPETNLEQINAGGSWRLLTPGRFTLDRRGTIVDACIEPDYRIRSDPADTLGALERLRVGAAFA
jgi:peroxiredoxin